MKFSLVFPGQGSQSIGMMKAYADLRIIQDTFSEASDILNKDFWAMANNGPPDILNLTANTQPIMLTSGIAMYRAWKSLGGPDPTFIAGHSLGEYTALVASGVITFKDALALVRFRGEVMQDAVPEGVGKMAAIVGLSDDVIRDICIEITQGSKKELLEPANYNSPGQVVVAGHKNSVLRGIKLAKKKGAKMAVLLPMSVPSHCSLMAPAARKIQKRLEMIKMQIPNIPVIHNADVKQHKNSIEIKGILVKQLCMPVRWTETINTISTNNVTHIAECGPGRVLTGLNKRISKDLKNITLTDIDKLHQAINNLI
tara:strand:- start:15810 stop:16748 length:939 start_codon:yes stop_codon:yes gene_type:complete